MNQKTNIRIRPMNTPTGSNPPCLTTPMGNATIKVMTNGTIFMAPQRFGNVLWKRK
jgi:hypothetical protein